MCEGLENRVRRANQLGATGAPEPLIRLAIHKDVGEGQIHANLTSSAALILILIFILPKVAKQPYSPTQVCRSILATSSQQHGLALPTHLPTHSVHTVDVVNLEHAEI